MRFACWDRCLVWLLLPPCASTGVLPVPRTTAAAARDQAVENSMSRRQGEGPERSDER